MTSFASVFPSTAIDTVTPEATPEIGSISSPGQPFGGFLTSAGSVHGFQRTLQAQDVALKWFRDVLETNHRRLQQDQRDALEHLISRPDQSALLRSHCLDLVSASFSRVKPHYEALTRPWLVSQPLRLSMSIEEHLMKLTAITKSITNIADLRNTGISLHEWLIDLANLSLHTWSAIIHTLPFRPRIEAAMAEGFCAAMTESVRIHSLQSRGSMNAVQPINLDLMPLQLIKYAALGDDIIQQALSSGLRKFLGGPALEQPYFRVDWTGRTSCIPRLQNWVQTELANLVSSTATYILSTPLDFEPEYASLLTLSAVNSLAQARIENLFDYVKAWPASEGAVEDIRAILTDDNTEHKLHLCQRCELQLETRLLHAGASTSDILAMYVNLIHTFEKLDARGVLLERVSPAVRKYLQSRNDTIHIIAESLLASSLDVSSSGACSAVTVETQRAIYDQNMITTQLMDWDDMTWTPEPIDAGPNHRNAKAKDVLSHILSLQDQDDFIKEFETALASRLLQSRDTEINHETRLLEMLKRRLDAAKLQNLEIMLKDVRDSLAFEKKLRLTSTLLSEPTPNEVQAAIPAQGIGVSELCSKFDKRIALPKLMALIKLLAHKRGDKLYPKRARLPPAPEPIHHADMRAVDGSELQVRILSASAWPQMQTSTFELPVSLEKQLQEAEERFSALSGQRKLKWRLALGTMSVRIELEDREIIEEDVPAWRGTVIHAFDGAETTHTVSELASKLSMEERLVQEALSFWVSKHVLYSPSTDRYAVLERLDMDSVQMADVVPVELVSALKSQDAVLHENAAMFEAFIGNMLRNGGPKEVGGVMGITSMMKMVLPTFTYGDDEVLWLLGQMLQRGEVVNDGDIWKVA